MRVICGPLKTTSPVTSPLSSPRQRRGAFPPQERTRIQAVIGKSSVLGRQGSEPKFLFWVQALLPSTQLSQITPVPILPGAPHSPSHEGGQARPQGPIICLLSPQEYLLSLRVASLPWQQAGKSEGGKMGPN